MLFVGEGATVDGDYYLKMLKKYLYVVRRLSCGQKFAIQQYGVCCHAANSVTNYLNKDIPVPRKENSSFNSCDLSLLNYAIWDIMEYLPNKNLKWHEDMEALSAVISWFMNMLYINRKVNMIKWF